MRRTLEPPGIILNGVGYFVDDAGKGGAGLPTKPFVKRDGTTSYDKVVEAIDKATFYRLQALIVRAVETHFQKSDTSSTSPGTRKPLKLTRELPPESEFHADDEDVPF
jgi:hypothetical protein